MDDIFKIGESNVDNRSVRSGTAFAHFGMKRGETGRNDNLRFHYIVFVMSGAVEISCGNYGSRRIDAGKMTLLVRSSSVVYRAVLKSDIYVLYFDTFLSLCDRNAFKAYFPDVSKFAYNFEPVEMPSQIKTFLENIIEIQSQNSDYEHYNEIKHREFFLLLRRFCPRDGIIALLAPIIGRSFDFRNGVLAHFSEVDGEGVAKLASLVGMGRKNFDKHFRDEFHTSPAKWMQRQTADRLRMFLSDPNATIADAMDKFHFNSPSHFNRFCRRYFDRTPGEMIKEARRSG